MKLSILLQFVLYIDIYIYIYMQVYCGLCISMTCRALGDIVLTQFLLITHKFLYLFLCCSALGALYVTPLVRLYSCWNTAPLVLLDRHLLPPPLQGFSPTLPPCCLFIYFPYLLICLVIHVSVI